MNACGIIGVIIISLLSFVGEVKSDESASVAPSSTAVEAQMPTVAIPEGDAIQASSTPTPLQASDQAVRFLDQNPLKPSLDLSNREGELNPEEEAYAMSLLRQQFPKDTVSLMNPDRYIISVESDRTFRSFDEDYDTVLIYELDNTPLFVHTNLEDFMQAGNARVSQDLITRSSTPGLRDFGLLEMTTGIIPLSNRPEIQGSQLPQIRDFLDYAKDNLSVTAFPLRSKDYDQILITPNFITLTTQAEFVMNEQFFAEMLKRFEFLTPDFLKEKGISFNLEEFNNPENYLKLEFEELTGQAWDKLSNYQVIETINLNSLMIAYMILNPPDTVHPFLRAVLRWFYGNSPMVQKYKNDRQRIIKMYQLAKDREDLKIQYVDEKGRRGIYETYLPRPDQGGFLSLIVVPTNSGQANASSPQ